VWESFDPDIKEQIKKAAVDSMRWQVHDVSRVGLGDGIEFLKSQGMTVTDPTPEQLAAFREMTKAVYEKWSANVGADIVKAFEEAVSSFK
jgi:TRAP-type C4-dicarboxylate transport system substrate-binding protein